MDFRTQFIRPSEGDDLILNHDAKIYGLVSANPSSYEYRDEKGKLGSHLAVQQYKHYLESLKMMMNLSSELNQANRKVYSLMMAKGTTMKEKHYHWQTSFGFFTIKNGKLHYAQIGDVDMFYKSRSGEIKRLGINSLKDIEKRCKTRYLNVNEENIRRMANVQNGYGIANGSFECKNYIKSGTVDVNGLDSLLMINKGMIPEKGEWEGMIRDIDGNGLVAYVQNQKNGISDPAALYFDQFLSKG